MSQPGAIAGFDGRVKGHIGKNKWGVPLKGGIPIPPPTSPNWGLKALGKRKEERVRENEHERL